MFALVPSKPSGNLINAALLNLQKLNVIQKYSQGDEELLWVLPYICCVLSPQRVDEILRKINEEGSEDDETEENAADQLAVLREDDPEL